METKSFIGLDYKAVESMEEISEMIYNAEL